MNRNVYYLICTEYRYNFVPLIFSQLFSPSKLFVGGNWLNFTDKKKKFDKMLFRSAISIVLFSCKFKESTKMWFRFVHVFSPPSHRPMMEWNRFNYTQPNQCERRKQIAVWIQIIGDIRDNPRNQRTGQNEMSTNILTIYHVHIIESTN